MIYKQILKQIKKYNNIVIAKHVGGDPDAFGSSLGLKDVIKENFPSKNVYVAGSIATRFRYFGEVDKIPEDLSNSLLIVVDTPDKKRVDGVNVNDFDYVIKIDHHPFIEKYGNLELIDSNASSASQMIIELVLANKLKISTEAAKKLYMGVVGDTGRFMYSYTTAKTFDLVSSLIKKTNLNFTDLYQQMYARSLNDYKFNAYITNNLVVTENKLAYIKIDDKVLKEYGVDVSTPGNLIENFNNIEDFVVIIFCTEDLANNYIKCSIRSRGPIINQVASNFNGGGHALASGAKPKDFKEAEELILALDNTCKEYLEMIK